MDDVNLAILFQFDIFSKIVDHIFNGALLVFDGALLVFDGALIVIDGVQRCSLVFLSLKYVNRDSLSNINT